MLFNKDKNEDEVELRFEENDDGATGPASNKEESEGKIDHLFQQQPAEKENSQEQTIKMLEYKIEKVIEQNSRIMDALERLTGSNIQNESANEKRVNTFRPREDNSNDMRGLW